MPDKSPLACARMLSPWAVVVEIGCTTDAVVEATSANKTLAMTDGTVSTSEAMATVTASASEMVVAVEETA